MLNLNKKFPKPIKIILSGLSASMEEVLKTRNYQNWPLEIRKEPDFKKLYPDAQQYSDLVYLTGDCDCDMADYDPKKTYIIDSYIIGGIVDHNKLKNLTANKADSLNIKKERFPIGQYAKLKTSAILSINHSFEILVRKYNGQDWESTIKDSIPLRKKEEGPDAMQEESSSSGSEEDEESGEEEEGLAPVESQPQN